jgi:hypothetical protein
MDMVRSSRVAFAAIDLAHAAGTDRGNNLVRTEAGGSGERHSALNHTI